VRARIADPTSRTSTAKYSPGRVETFPPASVAVLEASEASLGFRLPPLLRDLYTKVANGGFGPGYGILGLEGGQADPVITMGEEGGTLLDWYYAYRGTDGRMPELGSQLGNQDPFSLFIDPDPESGNWAWFDKLLPISHHGDWQLSCLDCSSSTYPVLRYDGQQSKLRRESPAFEDWIDAWLASN
jgi:hypothetical protein